MCVRDETRGRTTGSSELDEKMHFAGLAAQAGQAGQAGQAASTQGIGWAVKNLWHGLKVRRRGWHGMGMWLELQVPDSHSRMSLPYVVIRLNELGELVPWVCSQTDLLSTDWEIATAD